MAIDNIDEVVNFFMNPENVASLNRFDFRKLYYDANICSEKINYHVDFVKDLTQVLYDSKINLSLFVSFICIFSNVIITKYRYKP